MLGLLIFGPPLAYTALNVYLLLKIQPVPITLMPLPHDARPVEPEPVAA